MTTLRCAIVGGGIVGVAVAREFSRRQDNVDVTVYEKEDRLAAHQTGHNSGVVHAGLYYEPGGLKATLCRRGADLIRNFCESKSLPYGECGKLLIAQSTTELQRLRDIFDRAKANGVPGVTKLTGEQIRDVEPNAVGLAALHSPHTAITDYVAITNALAEDVSRTGGQILLKQQVTRIRETAQGVVVTTSRGEEHYDIAIACAGLQSDRLASASGDARNPRVVPFFGSYFLLDPDYRNLVRGLIYPVPDPKYPFLGIHLTRTIDGETMVGPNAFISPGRESYAWNHFDIKDMIDVARFRGFWNFAARNLPAAAHEIQAVVSRRKFLKEAKRFVPSLNGARLTPGTRGVRAQSMAANGELIDDFVISQQKHLTQVRNAPSPGATSSMAIAEYIVDGALKAWTNS